MQRFDCNSIGRTFLRSVWLRRFAIPISSRVATDKNSWRISFEMHNDIYVSLKYSEPWSERSIDIDMEPSEISSSNPLYIFSFFCRRILWLYLEASSIKREKYLNPLTDITGISQMSECSSS